MSQRGAGSALWGVSLLPTFSSALIPCVNSYVLLRLTSPGELSREKTGNRCCVNLCSINFNNDFHTLRGAAVRAHAMQERGAAGSCQPRCRVRRELRCTCCCCARFGAPRCTPWPSGRSVSWLSQRFLQARLCGWGS